MHQDMTPPSNEVVLNRCQDQPPVSVVTTVAPVEAQQTLYVATFNQLHAVSASDGRVRWCQQVEPTQVEPTEELSEHHGLPHRSRRYMLFGTPRVTNRVLYVCASGSGRYTYAFNAGDGTLIWRTPTDAWRVSMPFGDFAVPLVKEGIVYNGTYALNEQDGTLLWRIAIDTQWLSLHALVDDMIYAATQMGIYAINALNGEVHWHHALVDPHTVLSGPPIVADNLLYFGTSGSVKHPEKSYFCALDTETGIERWRYTMGTYVGAVVHNESIYVSLGNHLYALDKHSGSLRWKYQFVTSGHYSATIAENVLYVNRDGAYALNCADGTVLWHQPLGSSPSVSFTPSAIIDSVVYLARIDGHGRSVLYALNASNGVEYWHSDYPHQIIPLAVGQ